MWKSSAKISIFNSIKACPDGLEFRSTINARVWFKLDTCVDGKLSCHGCDDAELWDPGNNFPNANTDPPMKLPHKPNPTNGYIKPDFIAKPAKAPKEPEAPTLPPHVNPALKTCKLQAIPRPKGGDWDCNGQIDETISNSEETYWKAGSTCKIKCKSTKLGCLHDQNINFLEKKSMFCKNIDVLQKFRFSAKILIFDENLYFLQKYRFSKKI